MSVGLDRSPRVREVTGQPPLGRRLRHEIVGGGEIATDATALPPILVGTARSVPRKDNEDGYAFEVDTLWTGPLQPDYAESYQCTFAFAQEQEAVTVAAPTDEMQREAVIYVEVGSSETAPGEPVPDVTCN